MKKRGVPKEEKRRRILEIFHDSSQVFNKIEVDKKGQKMGVRDSLDILTELIGDDLVDTDKIGGGNFYWSFPSQALNRVYQQRKIYYFNKSQTIEKKNQWLSQKNIKMFQLKENKKLMRLQAKEKKMYILLIKKFVLQQQNERQRNLINLQKIRNSVNEKVKVVQKLNRTSKEKFQQNGRIIKVFMIQIFTIEEQINEFKYQANQWTENLISIKSYLKNKFFADENQINEQYGIPENLELID